MGGKSHHNYQTVKHWLTWSTLFTIQRPFTLQVSSWTAPRNTCRPCSPFSLQAIKPNCHPSCLLSFLQHSGWNNLNPQFTLMTVHADFFTEALCVPVRDLPELLCSRSQMATVSQAEPPGLLSHVPSWLAAVVSLHNNLTVSYDRSQERYEPWELCWC